MEHEIHRVTDFRQVGPFVLWVEFDDGTRREIDFEPALQGGLYASLRDPEMFRQVRLDPEVQTLVWPNGADFDPATLYDWPKVVDELAARVRSWEPLPAAT